MIPLAKMATPAAKSLLRQATALRPNRKKASDGLLPSAAHVKQNPDSDHNSGFAVDITHDVASGFDGAILFQKLRADKRVKYLIFNRKIWSLAKGEKPYDGVSPHEHHVHISIKETCGDDTSPWFPWMGKPKVVSAIKSKLTTLPKKVVSK